MNKPIATFFWRKLDGPGHDICRLFKFATGWRLSGMSVFQEGKRPCNLEYCVTTNVAWRTKSAVVSGYLGSKIVSIRITSAGVTRWRLNGRLEPKVTGCIDVDLGFTPATNLIAIRRLALKVGQSSKAPAAYLQFPKLRLVKLSQSYTRTGRAEYEYKAPTVGYSGTLRVLPSGAVSYYPGLFELVARV